jgi:uncharacterized membrane protein YeaQ/YmgE (transglycosylase-associated protein family)
MIPDVTSLMWFLTVGLIAGWMAGEMRQGQGFGLVGNILIGVSGALVGGVLMKYVDLGMPAMIGSVVAAFVGATVLLFVFDRIGLRA